MFKRFFFMALAVLIVTTFFAGNMYATKNVTFQVNMAIQIQGGNFVLNKNIVVARGDWEIQAGVDTANWGGYHALMAQGVSDSIFSLTVVFDDSMATKTINFKYVIADSTTHPPSGDSWEVVNNRTYVITSASNQQIPLVFFNDVSTLLVSRSVTFQATMDTLLAHGFNPATDSICVVGGLNGWGFTNTTKMLPQFGHPHNYQIQLVVKDVPGATESWKFRAAPFAKWDNTGYDQGPNNTFPFPGGDTTLAPLVPFITLKAAITQDMIVTFKVNMNGARERFHNSLITGLTKVYMSGTEACPPLSWVSAWNFADTLGTSLIKLYDDGTHGDVTPGDNIYSTQITFLASNFVSKNVVWKYGAVFSGVDTLNGGVSYLDNEAGYQQNHNAALDDANSTQTITDNYGDQVSSVSKDNTKALPVTYALNQNYPNPFNPTTTITYAIPVSGYVTLKVYNLLGQEVASVFEGHQAAGKYVATFDASRIASGMYIYRLEAGNYVQARKMLLLK